MLSAKQIRHQHFSFLSKLKLRSKATVVALLISMSLLASTFIGLGAGKARIVEVKNKQSLKCPPNGYTKKSLPLNLAKIPRPPIASKFLGLSRASFATSSNMFNEEMADQWCWGNCTHNIMRCSEGSISGGPCCFQCCNQWGCSDPGCCS